MPWVIDSLMTEYGNGDGACGFCQFIVMGLVRVDGDVVLGYIVRSSLAVGGGLLLNACLGFFAGGTWSRCSARWRYVWILNDRRLPSLCSKTLFGCCGDVL